MELVVRSKIVVNGGYVNVVSQEFKTMSSITYWGYLQNGHLVGYSKDLKTIQKRLQKKVEA